MNHLGDTNKKVGEDHIRDATKMVSDTPRTDAEAFFPHDSKYKVCDADFCRQLERELNAANDRIRRLEEAGGRMADVLTWSAAIQYKRSPTVAAWRKAKEAKP